MECIESIIKKQFCNTGRKKYIEKIKDEEIYKNIRRILEGENLIEIIINENIIKKMESHYNNLTKLVQYVKINNNQKVIYVGDIHGDFNAMINAFSLFDPKNNHIIFLGDIVDRGPNSVECIVMLFLYKIMFPNKVHIIRGNHECIMTSKIYGFYNELEYKNKSISTIMLFNEICKIFSHLPIIYIISNEINMYRICAVHGCIDKKTDLTIIENYHHAENNSIDECWNDPHPEIDAFEDEPSERGCGNYVVPSSIKEWMMLNHVNCIIRSHEVVENGYKFGINNESYLIHIFSQPNYCGSIDNKGAFAILNDDFTECEIIIFDNDYDYDEYVNNKKSMENGISKYFE
jgi:serine/threonine-protein phosphatase 5